jgi:hypothetical protein
MHVGRKSDIRQIEGLCTRNGLCPRRRFEFGDYLERLKRDGVRGSQDNGDFTFAELEERLREFLEDYS